MPSSALVFLHFEAFPDKFTGQSRGFGFVEMSSGREAQQAIQCAE